MSIPAWFDEYAYLNSKLNQLKASGVTGYTTITQVKAAIEAAGITSYDHFNAFSLAERTSPNDYFNTNEYLAAKAVQLNTAQGVTTWTAEKVALAFQNAGYTNAYQHFATFGWTEGVNPSNAFDVSSYLDLKAAETGMTVAEVTAAFQTAGFDPISHYLTVGSTESAMSVTAVPVSEQVAADTSSGSAGQTFTLTKSVDSVIGTSGNDTIIAGDDGGTASLNAGDSITGGSGTDTLKIYNAAAVTNGANFTTANISGVEYVEFSSAATTQALDVSGNADVTKVTLVNGLDAVVTAKLSQTIGLKGNINTNAAATSFVFTSTAGTADSANLEVDGASTAAGVADKGLSLQNVETLNLALSGTNVVGSFDSDATKLVITGDGSLTTVLTEAGGTASLVKTIDASAATGALNIDNKSFAGALETITLGSGDDRYVSTFATKDALDKIDMGAGSNDILAFSDATDLSTTTKAAVLAGASNYEAIEVTGTGAMKVDGDVSTGIKSFIADTTGALTATNIYAGTKITVGDVALAASTVGMKLGEKILDIVLDGTKTAVSNAGTNGITVTGATDINVTSNGFADVGNNTLTLTSDDNTTVNISGAKDVTVTTVAATGTTGFTIDGSSATGKLTLTGTAAVDTIKGGSAADTLNKSAGVDTFTGNGGADKFAVVTATGSDADILVAAIDVTAIITDFTTGSDTLSGFGTAASSTNYVEATSAASTLTAFKTAADAALDGNIIYYVGQVGSDSYVAVDTDGTGFTDLIKLTGVSLDGIAQADIVA